MGIDMEPIQIKNNIGFIKIKVKKIEIPLLDLNKLLKEKDDIRMDIRYHFFSSVFSI